MGQSGVSREQLRGVDGDDKLGMGRRGGSETQQKSVPRCSVIGETQKSLLWMTVDRKGGKEPPLWVQYSVNQCQQTITVCWVVFLPTVNK